MQTDSFTLMIKNQKSKKLSNKNIALQKKAVSPPV